MNFEKEATSGGGVAISPLFVDRFGRSLRFCNLQFTIFYNLIRDPFLMVTGVKMSGIGKGF